MEKSNHRNYIEWYDRNRNDVIAQKIIPYEKNIFELFNQKFYEDAQKDGDRGRERLMSLWISCANCCRLIHENLMWVDLLDTDLKKIVKDIVNMDYDSLYEFFYTLKATYSTQWNQYVASKIAHICIYLEKMRKISKKHTNVISKS